MTPRQMWLRQLGAVLRLEWRKTLFSRRGWWIYLLALLPVVLTGGHWLFEVTRGTHRHSMGEDSLIFAGIFQVYYLRMGIFFGCVGLFSNLFRGEMLERTLHYYYLSPLRREVLVLAKYLAGVGAAVLLFSTSAGISFLIMGKHFGPAWNDFVWHGPGRGQLGWYMLVAALACVGYGAVFLAAGLLVRNPMIPAAVVWVWENLNPFLPEMLKKISVIFYLKSLCPVDVPVTGNLAIMAINADPTPPWVAIPGLLGVAALVLAYAAVSSRRAEISYSGE
jgi:hypothetical protein